MIECRVINASPLILLGKTGQLPWVPRLGRLVIPEAVAREIQVGGAADPTALWLAGEGSAFITPDAGEHGELNAWDLGAGETAVIARALCEAPAAEAILDDAAARRCAAAHGVPVRGTLSLVALAKRRGLIPECRPVFVRLATAGLFVTPALLNQVLTSAGEPVL